MSSDYFLVHRGLQVQRLMSRTEGNQIVLPPAGSRASFASATVDLLTSLERIDRMKLGESSSGMLSWVSGRNAAGLKLSEKQRELIRSFERQLVMVRMGEDAAGAKCAAGVMNALLKDYAFFDGLKPLPQYTNQFAYEFLYPTWFNLYRSMRMPLPDANAKKFTDEQIADAFAFLRDYSPDGIESADTLLGTLTFIAHRFGTRAADDVQRLIDVCRYDRPKSPDSALVRLKRFSDRIPDASQLEGLLHNWLLVERAMQGLRVHRRTATMTGRPVFPKELTALVRGLENREQDCTAHQQLLRRLGHIVQEVDGFEKRFADFFTDDPVMNQQLLDLCVTPGEDETVLSRRGQGMLANAMGRFRATPTDWQHFQPLARNIVTRTDALEATSCERFCEEFIEKEQNLRVLMTSAGNETQRDALVKQLLKAAKSATAPDQFLELLLFAGLLDTSTDLVGLASIQRSIYVLSMSAAEESISERELDDLVGDLREHLTDALEMLRAPALAGRGKPEKLARLYLALNEACHQFEVTRRVGNFGLTKAALGNLGRLTE